MCGIAGFIGDASQFPACFRQDANSPLNTLAHRGPDSAGWSQLPISLGASQVLLLHRRLSILDLSSAGRQPMSTADGQYVLVYNGEIYNYRELRRELEQLGHGFRTGTDTEVLLQAYAQWGEQCLTRLVGMFAFALLDRPANRLFLARDFFGIKPLYYVRLPHCLAFASEIKGLLHWLPLKRTANAQRVYDYLRFGWTDHGSDTLWSEISQVPAAHFLDIALGDRLTARIERYWQPGSAAPLDISFEEAATLVRDEFLNNLKLHLRSDVPIGVALSGGIDSSAILAGMRYLEPRAELHAISFVSHEPGVSEEQWIDLMGRHARAEVHKVYSRGDELLDDLDRLIVTQDEPFASTSIYAQNRVFQKAREVGVKVMLDGQGADEMLAGYRYFMSARLASLLRQGSLVEAWRFARRVQALPGAPSHWRFVLRALRHLLTPWLPTDWVESACLPAWLNRRWIRAHDINLSPQPRLRQRDSLREQLQQSLTATSLPMLLRYEDRNSMAHSIESRVPFLTVGLADLASSLPEKYVLGDDGTTKNVFRSAMRGIMPDAILDRRDKVGFATPEHTWLQTLRPWIDQTLTGERARAIPILNTAALLGEWRRIQAGQVTFDFRVWRWLNLIRWAERYQVIFDEGCVGAA